MTPDHGVYEIKCTSLKAVCEPGAVEFNRTDRRYEFALRWEDGEIAEDILILDTDGYYDGREEISFQGDTYRMEFGEDLIEGVLGYHSQAAKCSKVQPSIALRYYIEFDAFLDANEVGGSGVWQGGTNTNIGARRTPKEFIERWVNQIPQGGDTT